MQCRRERVINNQLRKSDSHLDINRTSFLQLEGSGPGLRCKALDLWCVMTYQMKEQGPEGQGGVVGIEAESPDGPQPWTCEAAEGPTPTW